MSGFEVSESGIRCSGLYDAVQGLGAPRLGVRDRGFVGLRNSARGQPSPPPGLYYTILYYTTLHYTILSRASGGHGLVVAENAEQLFPRHHLGSRRAGCERRATRRSQADAVRRARSPGSDPWNSSVPPFYPFGGRLDRNAPPKPSTPKPCRPEAAKRQQTNTVPGRSCGRRVAGRLGASPRPAPGRRICKSGRGASVLASHASRVFLSARVSMHARVHADVCVCVCVIADVYEYACCMCMLVRVCVCLCLCV